MNILITGGAGFIGSHITEMLCDEGYSVTVLDDLSFGYEDFVDSRSEFVKGSLANIDLLDNILENKDIVIHLAASSIIKFSFDDPIGYYENNIINGIKLLEAMKRKNVKKIIFSSTASVYGEPQRVPIKETDSKNPLTVYGSSKLAYEQILSLYYKNSGIESVSLRYYNAYGPRDEQKPATRAVPMWMDAVLRNKPIPWYWQGRQTRDYVYVKDIARAHLAVMSLSGSRVFNIGSGTGVIMADVLHAIEKIVGRNLETIDMGERQGDPMKLVADISAIKDAVGWEPSITLEEGLMQTYEYYRKKFKH